jgi:hypothetical protein
MTTAVITTLLIRILLMFGIPLTVLSIGGWIIDHPKSKAAQALQRLVRRIRKKIAYILSLYRAESKGN